MNALFRRETALEFGAHLRKGRSVVIAAIVSAASRVGINPGRATRKFKRLLPLRQHYVSSFRGARRAKIDRDLPDFLGTGAKFFRIGEVALLRERHLGGLLDFLFLEEPAGAASSGTARFHGNERRSRLLREARHDLIDR